ncbi:ferritin-like domain-containing protein [Daedaleopsis nitida]|nr:ferritin-like domain-containing protein [Daedaleopsis nitida]
MPSFASLLALAAPMMALAAPSPIKRDTATNLLVLKFADVLEQFESQFYQQALQKFQPSDFTAAGFVSAQVPTEQFTQIQADEAAHATALESTIVSLGDKPITDCQFNFGNALDDVATMAPTARVVENLGVAAYLGAAHLIDDPVLLTAAGSILTVEARHQTILNVLNSGASIPQAFDIALLPNEVMAVAGAFISNCNVGVTANQPLTVTNTGAVAPGTALTFSSPAINGSTDGLFCQMLVGGMPDSISLPFDQCVVPQGIEGPVAIFVTSDNQPLNNNVRDRANQPILAGPTMAFIDTQKQLLSQLALAAAGTSGNNSGSASTTTITPPEASSIIASASTAAAAAPTSGSGTQNPAAPPASSASPALPATPAAPESDNTVVDSPNTRNVATGPSKSGMITIDGWQADQPPMQPSA